MSTRKQTKGFLLGALVGGVIGSITALLLAPKAGKELRSDISAGAQKVGEKTVEVASQVSDTTGRIAKQIGGHAIQIVDKTKQTAAQVACSVRNRSKGTDETESLSDSTALIAVSIEDNEAQASTVNSVEAGETEAAVTKEISTSVNN